MKYIVKTNIFEGPLAVMYEMIEKRNLSVSEFSLLEITNDFIDFVKTIDQEDKIEIANFINTASILILLKSKSLLPEGLFEEEDRSLNLLENQLKAYALLKDVIKEIKSIWDKSKILKAKIKNKIILENIFMPDAQIDLKVSENYLKERLAHLIPQKEDKREIKVDRKIKIEDALSHVRLIIKKLKNTQYPCGINFNNLHTINDIGDERLREKTKKTIVILFLSLLELVKLGEINVEQENLFGDIIIQENEYVYE